MGLFSHFFKRPRPNQVLDEDGALQVKHHGETWMDLFVDLVIVAFLLKLGKAISYCLVHDDELEWTILLSSAFNFLIFFFLWLELDTYANLFHSHDVVSRILYFFFMMGLGCMAISMPGDDQGDCFYLGLKNSSMMGGYFLAQSSVLLMYFVALKANPHTIGQLGYHVCMTSSIIVLFVILGVSLPQTHRDILYKVLVPTQILLTVPFFGRFLRPIFNEKVAPTVFGSMKAFNREDCYNLLVIPFNVHVFQSRLCLFIMMVTGEGMIQIISPTLPQNANYYGRIVLFNTSGFVILYGSAMLYADAVLREDVTLHALTRSPYSAGLLWTWLHVVTGFFIFLIGVCIEISISDVYENIAIAHAHDTLLGISCGCIVLSLNLMRSTHKGVVLLDPQSPDKKSFKKNLYRLANYVFRVVLGVLHFVVASFTHNDSSEAKRSNDKYIYLHAAIVIISIGTEIGLSTYVKIRRRERPSLSAIEVRESFKSGMGEDHTLKQELIADNQKSISIDSEENSF